MRQRNVTPKEQLNVRVPRSMADAIAAAAADEKRSIADIVREALSVWLHTHRQTRIADILTRIERNERDSSAGTPGTP